MRTTIFILGLLAVTKNGEEFLEIRSVFGWLCVGFLLCVIQDLLEIIPVK